MCGVDRLGNIYTGLICDGRPKYTDIDRALSEVVEDNSILCTDKHRRRNKPKKFFAHANSTHSISLIKDFKIRRPIYV